MKNKVTSIIFLISIILLIFLMFTGVKIGKFQILSLAQLREKNNNVNDKINEASKLTSVDYPDTINNFEKTYEEYNIEKSKYEELSGFNAEDSDKQIYETKKYDIEYIWKKVGQYAKAGDKDLSIGIDVQKASGQSDLYNLNFTVSGQYTDIITFITKLENDSDLYFRIYNFKMEGNQETITATFKVNNINIDNSTLINSSSNTDKLTETETFETNQ